MQAVTPVTIIGGYLGCGKTTLVNHLLRNANGARLAVLVNDFGELPIDADLIEARDGDVISLSGGCVCCSFGDDLSRSLKTLRALDSLPDHIFIEASGVALPGAIGNSLSLLRGYQLEGVVVLVDATSVQAASVQKYIGDTIDRQLNDADLLVLNKMDLLNDSQAIELRQWICEYYAHAPLVEAVYSKIDPAILLNIKTGRNSRDASNQADYTHDISSMYSSISLRMDQQVDVPILAERLSDKGCGLVRAKGFVMDYDNSIKTIQVVGRRWSVTNAPAGVETGLVCIATSSELTEEKLRSFCNIEVTKQDAAKLQCGYFD